MLPPELPPISNKLLYACRVFGKLFSFLVFGVSTLILVIIVFPFMRLVFHPIERFRKYGRFVISAFMRFFVSLMHCIGIVNLKTDNREKYRHLSSKIIVANHPSILDVVMLLSLVPNADCIVNMYLNSNFIVKGVVRQLYILNSLNHENLLQACAESLKQGNCLIIFPEGTRTPRYGHAMGKQFLKREPRVSLCIPAVVLFRYI